MSISYVTAHFFFFFAPRIKHMFISLWLTNSYGIEKVGHEIRYCHKKNKTKQKQQTKNKQTNKQKNKQTNKNKNLVLFYDI